MGGLFSESKWVYKWSASEARGCIVNKGVEEMGRSVRIFRKNVCVDVNYIFRRTARFWLFWISGNIHGAMAYLIGRTYTYSSYLFIRIDFFYTYKLSHSHCPG